MLTPLELATNKVYGLDPSIAPLPKVSEDLTTLQALEAAVLPAVASPPCVVTFSGGRDSSLVLAVATRVARREGLPDPIAATINFVGIERAEESYWQELVMRHLQLENWVSRDISHEFDVIGPLAAPVLRHHGVLYPLNLYVHNGLIDHARGGSLMTGMHGDSVFGGGRWVQANEVLGGQRRPMWRDTLRVGLAVAPSWAKRRVMKGRLHVPPYLTAEARAEYIDVKSRSEAGAPRRFDLWMDNLARRRSVSISTESMERIAADADALLVQPLADRDVMATIARAGGNSGIGNRTSMMRSLFTELLPDELLARNSKAVFGDAFVGEWTREFVRNWDGSGVDTRIVDPERLHAAWLDEEFDFRAALLLQQVWLAGQ